jgi:indolepyruvate ferredoxin oxidoreductase beta subunit
MKSFSILVAGVGGQGILSAARLLAQAAVNAGERVVVGDTFGASQREGSVMSVVRLGEDVRGALVAPGGAEMLISFEPYEALRRLHVLRNGGTILVNTVPVLPVRAALEGGYPPIDEVWTTLERKADCLVRLNASASANELAIRYESRYNVTTVIILGAASTLPVFPIDEAALVETMEQRFDERSLPMNREAFAAGKRLALEGGAA